MHRTLSTLSKLVELQLDLGRTSLSSSLAPRERSISVSAGSTFFTSEALKCLLLCQFRRSPEITMTTATLKDIAMAGRPMPADSDCKANMERLLFSLAF